jgi:hypothetical protein
MNEIKNKMENKTKIEGKGKRKREKTVWKYDKVIAEVRKAIPLNRSKLKAIAVEEFIKTHTLEGRISTKDIAKIVQSYRGEKNLTELNDVSV